MIHLKSTILSVAFLMGTVVSLSADPVDPLQNPAEPATDKAQPTMADVAWSGGHFPGAIMIPRGFTRPAMPHAVGGYGAIPLKNLAPTELEARKNSIGTNTLTCVPGISC